MKKQYRGSCHCGEVRFEVDLDLATGTTKCNCSSCWKRRWWNAKVLPDEFRPMAGVDALSEGERGGFCTRCGVPMFMRFNTDEWGEGWGGDRVSISVACLDDLDPAELVAAPVQYCDGKNDNWWNPPAQTAHL